MARKILSPAIAHFSVSLRMRRIIIAIDGYVATGKSTTAKGVAARLNYLHIDSGAMYRALAWYLLEAGIQAPDEAAIQKVLGEFEIHLEREGQEMIVYLGGRRLDQELRQPEVASFASVISTFSAVREKMVAEQRRLGQGGGIVMDGRDIGTVVFPQAELKVFMIADLEARARRRYEELRQRGYEITLEAVQAEIAERDHRDETRPISPLRRAPDARILDTTHLTIPQQIEQVVAWAEACILAPQPS